MGLCRCWCRKQQATVFISGKSRQKQRNPPDSTLKAVRVPFAPTGSQDLVQNVQYYNSAPGTHTLSSANLPALTTLVLFAQRVSVIASEVQLAKLVKRRFFYGG